MAASMGRIKVLTGISFEVGLALTHTGGFPERGSSANRADSRLARSRKGFFIWATAADRRYRTLAAATNMRHLFLGLSPLDGWAFRKGGLGGLPVLFVKGMK